MVGRALSLFICAGAAWVAVPAPTLASAAPEPQETVLPSRIIGTGDLEFSIPDIAAWEQRLLEVRQWLEDYESWKQWNAAWRNKREPGWMHTRDRHVRPDPPAWL